MDLTSPLNELPQARFDTQKIGLARFTRHQRDRCTIDLETGNPTLLTGVQA